MSRKVPTFKAKIVNGKVVPIVLGMFQAYLKHFQEGDIVDLIVKKPFKSKTNEQLGYYHACVKPSAAEGFIERTGHPVTLEQADGALSKIFLTVDKGTELERVRSKADLSTKEMSIFIEQCIHMIASEFGVCVPLAGEWKQNWKFEEEHQR